MSITEDEFMKMKMNEKLLVLFRNTNLTRTELRSVILHRKVQYVTIGAIGVALSFLAYKVV